MPERVFFRDEFINRLEKIKDSKQGKDLRAILEIIEKKAPSGYFIYRWGGKLEVVESQAFEWIMNISEFRNFLERRRDQLLKKPSFIKKLLRYFAWGGFWGFFGGSVAVGALAGLAGLMMLIPSLTFFATTLFTVPIAPIVGSVVLVGGVLLGLVLSIWPAFKSYQQERMLIESYSTEIKSILYGASEELHEVFDSVMSWRESFFVKKGKGKVEITLEEKPSEQRSEQLIELIYQLKQDTKRLEISQEDCEIKKSEDKRTAIIDTRDNKQALSKISYLLCDASVCEAIQKRCQHRAIGTAAPLPVLYNSIN